MVGSGPVNVAPGRIFRMYAAAGLGPNGSILTLVALPDQGSGNGSADAPGWMVIAGESSFFG